MMGKWLSVIGIGEDGLEGLSAAARALVENAEVLAGGARHLAMVNLRPDQERMTWTPPFHKSIDDLLKHRGQAVCVLATGDPMCYGVGVRLAERVGMSEMTVFPSLSAFSLACSRLGWARANVDCLSLHGRPLELINAVMGPGAKLLVLSTGGDTPAAVAGILAEKGYGAARITVLERLGGTGEKITHGTAAKGFPASFDPLNTLAIECPVGKDAPLLPMPRVPGLADAVFLNDGQLTKREVRAATLAALGPVPGQLLWDVGAGCGSVSVEWMRAHPTCRAVAIEKSSHRIRYISDNAAGLGVPGLDIVEGEAPAALSNLAPPDAVFIGGGVTGAGVMEACWGALRRGGRLVVNTVTFEGEDLLREWLEPTGGELVRIAIERGEGVGSFSGWRPLRPVVQLRAIKS